MADLIPKLDLSDTRRRALLYSYLLNKKLSRKLRSLARGPSVEVHKVEDDYDSHLDDMPLTLNRDPEPKLH